MPPAPHQYHGTAAIWSFLRASFEFRGDREVRLVPTGANTQPALASYLSDRAGPATPAGLFVLTMDDQKIRAVTRFHLDTLYPRFGLAGSLPAAAARPQLPLTLGSGRHSPGASGRLSRVSRAASCRRSAGVSGARKRRCCSSRIRTAATLAARPASVG